MENIWQDLRYGARSLMRMKGFTAVAIITLALGIGANTAIFTIVNSVLLRPLPYPQSEKLMIVGRYFNETSAVSDLSYQNSFSCAIMHSHLQPSLPLRNG